VRRVKRLPLSQAAMSDLAKLQTKVDSQVAKKPDDVGQQWKSGTKIYKEVRKTLQRMMGERERCMYCLDSHGADVEHFWPKTTYPERMFDWNNLLLCRTECGRMKGLDLSACTDAALAHRSDRGEPGYTSTSIQ